VVDPEPLAVRLQRVQQDTVRGRTRIDRARPVPTPHSTLVGPDARMRDMGP